MTITVRLPKGRVLQADEWTRHVRRGGMRVECSSCGWREHELRALGPGPRPDRHGWLCAWCIERLLELGAIAPADGHLYIVVDWETRDLFRKHGVEARGVWE